MARTKRKSGPKMVYAGRDATETMRLSPLAKQLLRSGAERAAVSVGDFVEHLARTRAATVTRDEFPPDERASV